MSFESRVVAFSERFLSDRSFQLIVAPALADLQFDPGSGRRGHVLNRLAVLRALAGGLRNDVAREVGSFAVLTLVPACYYILPLAICFEYCPTWGNFFAMATLILALSLFPVMVCFWPERRSVRPLA